MEHVELRFAATSILKKIFNGLEDQNIAIISNTQVRSFLRGEILSQLDLASRILRIPSPIISMNVNKLKIADGGPTIIFVDPSSAHEKLRGIALDLVVFYVEDDMTRIELEKQLRCSIRKGGAMLAVDYYG